jgi:hypothetical protein
MLINIPEDIAHKLEKLAEEQGSSVGDVLKELLNRYAPDPSPGTLAEIAENARETGLASAHPVDTAERSREILGTEYADYLKGRIDNNADDDHNG